MTAITIAQVLSARFRVSKDVDDVTSKLHNDLNLGSKGRLVRLAVGRSLGLNAFAAQDENESDLKGQEVPARAVFKDEDVEIWLGLLSCHARLYGPERIDSMEALRRAIRAHWQRGVLALKEDWEAAGENYERFVHSLVERRAYLRDIASGSSEGVAKQEKKAVDASEQVGRALREVGVDAEIKGQPIHGPRTTRYRIFLRDVNQLAHIERRVREIGLMLNVQSGVPTIARGDEARVVFLTVPRPKETWVPVKSDAFDVWRRALSREKIAALPIFLGLDELGLASDLLLSEAPHLFVAGTTNSGKSVCMHAIVASLLATQKPDELQLALIDTKQVEFARYQGCERLFQDTVAFDGTAGYALLNELVVEMEARYSLFRQRNVSNWAEARAAALNVPRIVVFIEELADFLLARKDADKPVIALAQKARAAGIHLVLATQRPDAKTFAGLLRSNIPSRIALTVQKASESTIILDEAGAEELLGAGDMLVKVNGAPPKRVHGVLLDKEFLAALIKRT